MSKRIKKTDNYFERVKQRANRTNYRYYFFDYLYFKGEQGHKMRSRCSGLLMLSLYWWFIIEIPCLPLFDRNLPHTWYLLCSMGMFLFPVLFCLVRYRKDRTSALVSHYRHSSKNKITITLLLLLPMVLCGFELWLLAKLGWIICNGVKEFAPTTSDYHYFSLPYIQRIYSNMEQRITSFSLYQ